MKLDRDIQRCSLPLKTVGLQEELVAFVHPLQSLGTFMLVAGLSQMLAGICCQEMKGRGSLRPCAVLTHEANSAEGLIGPQQEHHSPGSRTMVLSYLPSTLSAPQPPSSSTGWTPRTTGPPDSFSGRSLAQPPIGTTPQLSPLGLCLVHCHLPAMDRCPCLP
jgi:hypothetical protein